MKSGDIGHKDGARLDVAGRVMVLADYAVSSFARRAFGRSRVMCNSVAKWGVETSFR